MVCGYKEACVNIEKIQDEEIFLRHFRPLGHRCKDQNGHFSLEKLFYKLKAFIETCKRKSGL